MAKFKTKSDIIRLVAPEYTGEHWSSSTEGFGMRVGTLKKGGGFERIFLARWRDEDGKDQKFKIGFVDEMNFSDAENAAREKVREEKRAAADAKAGIKRAPTLKEAYDSYLEAKRAGWRPDTLTDYDKRFAHLEPFYDRCVLDITPVDWFDRYMLVSAKSGPAMALAANSLGRAIYGYLIAEGLVTVNPCHELKNTAKKKGLIISEPEPSERHVPLELVPDYWHILNTRVAPAQRDYMLWMLFTGFRQSMVGTLAWDRLNIQERTYLVYAADRGNKSKTAFNYPISDELWERVVAPRLALRKPGEKWIIESPKHPGTPMHNVRGSHKLIGGLLGIVLSDHDIRRTFGSVAYAATKDLLTVQRLMTHSQKAKNRRTAVTELYVRTAERTFREAVNMAAAQFMLYTKKDSGYSGQLPSLNIDITEADEEEDEALAA